MQSTDVPTRFPNYWGYNAGAGFIRDIPEASQIGIETGAASLEDGFVPVNFTPVGAGGTPPFGKDFNGIFRQITQWSRWQAAAGPVVFDATFASSISGYPKGALLMADTLDAFWLNTAEGNTNDPDAAGANWIGYQFTGMDRTGDFKWRPTEETILGYVKANATTIGNASSNGTGRANVDAYNLFVWHWTNFSNTQCPVYTSGGSPTTRGASAADDWAANKAITVIDLRGTNPIGMDTMGGSATTRLASVPVTSGSASVAASVIGENLHQLTEAELAAHDHGVTDPGHYHTYLFHNTTITYNSGATGPSPQITTTSLNTSTDTTGITIDNAGGDTAHNTVARSMTGTWYIKL